MLDLAMTVMSQRLGLLDWTSMTERTSPVTGDPSMVTVAFGRDVDDSGSVSRLLNRSSRTFACFTKRLDAKPFRDGLHELISVAVKTLAPRRLPVREQRQRLVAAFRKAGT
jgi:hypothetical protein